MNNSARFLVFTALLACSANAATILGSAGNFAVLAGSTITNTGPSIITGDIGVSPGTAITGFPPGTVVLGTIHSSDTAAGSAEADLLTANGILSGSAATVTLTGTNLGGLTLASGVYKFDSNADLTGDLTLTGSGTFIFQIATSFNIANNAAIFTTGGADFSNLYFQMGSSATIGTGVAAQGNFVALQSISMGTGSSLQGRALAMNGAVTLDNNAISISSTTPEPASLALCGLGLSAMLCGSFRRKQSREL